MSFVTRLLGRLGPPSLSDGQRAESARILHASMVGVIGVLVLWLLAMWPVPRMTLSFIVLYIAVSAIGLWLLRYGFVRSVGLAYCISLWAAVAAGQVVLGHRVASVVASFLNIMLLAGFAVSGSAVLRFGLLSALWVGGTVWLGAIGRMPVPMAVWRPMELALQTSVPLLFTTGLAAYGFARQRRAVARAEASERQQAQLSNRHRTLAELGERSLRIENLRVFAEQLAAELQLATAAEAVAVYVAGPTALERVAGVGGVTPAMLTRELPQGTDDHAPGTGIRLSSASDLGLESRGELAWAGLGAHPTLAILLLRSDALEKHDRVLLGGCAALLAAVLQRLDAEQQLRHSQRMETIGQLAGGVAHDFNNLLTSIIGSSELVLMRLKDPEQRRILEDVIHAGEQGAVLTKRLLSFARYGVLEFRTLDLREVTRSVGGMLKRLLGPQVNLNLQVDGEPVWVRADQPSVEQILLNLVLNARDATQGRGHVWVSVRADPMAGSAVLSVRDDGVGMDESVRGRVFEPFFTTKAVGKGTGLGLWVVRSAADALGGRVDVSSSSGQGSEFRVTLPLAREVPLDTLPASEAQVLRAQAGERVLVVDDDHIVRRTLVGLLNQAGFAVLEAEDGLAALEALARGAAPTAIVSDILMPRMDGFELLQTLRARGMDTPVVLLTGYAELDVAQAPPALAGVTILRKPTTASALTAAIRNAVDARISARIAS